MTTTDTRPDSPHAPETSRARSGQLRRLLSLALTERTVLLVILLVVVLVWMTVLGNGGYLVAPYDVGYLASALESAVPLCMLALAQLVVMVSGRGGIDLSVGSMVSLSGMAFGFMVGKWGWPVLPAIVCCVLVGAVLGAINGLLVAWLRFPALIATLATYYAYSSLSTVSNANAPISTPAIQDLHDLTRSHEILGLPAIPLQVFTFLVRLS